MNQLMIAKRYSLLLYDRYFLVLRNRIGCIEEEESKSLTTYINFAFLCKAKGFCNENKKKY
jgi:hypothetical protein